MNIKEFVRLTPASILACGSVAFAAKLFIRDFRPDSWRPELQLPPVDSASGWTAIGIVLVFLFVTWLLVRVERASKRPRIGHILVAMNKISVTRLESALKEFKRAQLLGTFLVERGYVAQKDIEAALSLQRGLAEVMETV